METKTPQMLKPNIKQGPLIKYPKKREPSFIPRMFRSRSTTREVQNANLAKKGKKMSRDQKKNRLLEINEKLKKEQELLKEKSSRERRVNFSSDERRWTYDKYWMIRKMIIIGICFEHIAEGQKTGKLNYKLVKNEIPKKINDFNKLVKSHPPVKNHFEEEDKIFFDVLNKVVSMANDKYNEKKKIMKEIEELKHPRFNLTTEEDDNDKARLDDLKNELVVINENESKLLKKRKQLWGEEDLLNEVIKDESGKPNDLNARIRPKKKKTMSDWVRLPPKGELNKVEKELIQSILEDGGKILGFKGSSVLIDLKKKYFHGPKVPNDSDILKDFDLDIDAFLKENEASQEGESTSATPPPREEGISSKEFEDGMDALVGLGGRRTIRKRRTRREVRKKGTKKKARRRRTRRTRQKKRRRKRRTRKN